MTRLAHRPAIAHETWSTGLTIIAVDGASATGKSSVSRGAAALLDALLLDTGEFFRTATAIALQRHVEPTNVPALLDVISSISISCFASMPNTVEIEQIVPRIANHPEVQNAVTRQLESSIENCGIYIVTGRSIASSVFPSADLKVYLVSSLGKRAERKSAQLGITQGLAIELLNLRDTLDSTRQTNPARMHPRAIQIDTTDTEPADVAQEIVRLYRSVT